MTKFNSELAHRVLDQIELHPETWDQNYWRCSTGMCFAGWAAEMSPGVEWVGEVTGSVSDYVTVDLDVYPELRKQVLPVRDHVYTGDEAELCAPFHMDTPIMSVDDFAHYVLGIDYHYDEDELEPPDLFAAGNKLSDLKHIVQLYEENLK